MEEVHSHLPPASDTHMLRMLSQGAPVAGILNELCNFIDASSPGAIPTVLLLDSDESHFKLAAGPKVPKSWNKALDSLNISSCSNFRGAAGHQQKYGTIADMTRDPSSAISWAPILKHGIQAAWVAPILSKNQKMLGTLMLFYPTPHSSNQHDLELMEWATHLAAIAIESHRNEEDRHKFVRRLHQSQDEERRRIARELHDSTGQKLALLAINLSMAKQAASTQIHDDLLSECGSLTKSISDELRTLSYLLHPPLLDECGLEAAIQWYVSGINQRPGLRVDVEISEDLRRLTGDAELAIFRVVQASLTNVHLHSKAIEAVVKIEHNAAEVIVIVSDNGKGIPAGVLDYSSRTKSIGVGIAGMRERMEQLGGHLKIESNRRGTTVTATVPNIHVREMN
jgi:signal transduction histidine kinase